MYEIWVYEDGKKQNIESHELVAHGLERAEAESNVAKFEKNATMEYIYSEMCKYSNLISQPVAFMPVKSYHFYFRPENEPTYYLLREINKHIEPGPIAVGFDRVQMKDKINYIRAIKPNWKLKVKLEPRKKPVTPDLTIEEILSREYDIPMPIATRMIYHLRIEMQNLTADHPDLPREELEGHLISRLSTIQLPNQAQDRMVIITAFALQLLRAEEDIPALGSD